MQGFVNDSIFGRTWLVDSEFSIFSLSQKFNFSVHMKTSINSDCGNYVLKFCIIPLINILNKITQVFCKLLEFENEMQVQEINEVLELIYRIIKLKFVYNILTEFEHCRLYVDQLRSNPQ